MQLDYLITDLALILIVAGAVTILMKMIKQPVVLGYIIAGFLISPNFTYIPTIVASEDIHVWANIGVVFLMFGLGLEFSFKKIATVGGSAFVVAATIMLAMIFIGSSIGSLLGWNRMDCIFLGNMLSMSSTMIILKAYEEYNLKNEKFAQLVLGTLVIEDIAGIFMMIVLSTISVSKQVSGLEMFKEIGLLLAFLAIWLLIGIYTIPTILRKLEKILNDELILIISIGLCLGMVVIANLIGFSSALGAFMAGSILAGTVRAQQIERLMVPIKDMFGAIFFVSIGMMIEPKLIVEYLHPILIISAVTIVGQMIFATIGILLSGQSLHTAIRGGFSMVQIGEFSFIIATLGMSLGVISSFLYPIVVCVSVITSFTTPIFIKNSQKVYEKLNSILPDNARMFLRRNTSENRNDRDKDRDWYVYIKRVIERTLIGSTVLFIIYWCGIHYLIPFVNMYIMPGFEGTVVSGVIICAAMVPFVNLMHGTDTALYTKLWLKQRSNRLSLLTLKAIRVFIAAGFVAMVLKHIFNIPFGVLLVIAAIPIILVIRSEYIKGKTINMQMRFMANFSQKTLAKQKKERKLSGSHYWLNESMYIAIFDVVSTPKNDTVYDFSKDKAFQVTIIRIIRDSKLINLPKPQEKIEQGDVLHIMGTKDEVDACILLLESKACIERREREIVTLKNYIYGQTFYGVDEDKQLMCCPIRVRENSEFIKKSIKNSGMRERYRGSIIGIERGDLPIINPGIETIIHQGDLLWLIGSSNMVNMMMRADILEE